MPFTLAAPLEALEEIKKSRFLTRAFPLHSFEHADNIIKDIRQEDATHHCFAWKYGLNYRFSDDGEPTGTAGKPILNAIEGRDWDRILVIITRWYGGIQLGTGGLARAYGGGAARLLQNAEREEIIDWGTVTFHCPFHLITSVENETATFQAKLIDQQFDAEGCLFSVQVPNSMIKPFASWLKERSAGRIELQNDL
ncbi:IMPACT family protein [Bartonella tamiae]|uniref:Impact N-terminal domain-containing protein n=1 Tax=Bartonella tamiae Th239 TaxID=1094558 RepID=J1K2R5_9HYPH|nr:YigZ family protein [Bartonella tamiae]EJF91787.1 hypothetical protein ME5_00166 [Bartonella tamiae Th239]EJF92545.1 hypothetical protein MEG_01715 [Bartonella tamiae Th307]